jgi:hypothetical protein
VTRHCAECGDPFEAKRSTAKYCGTTCRSRASVNRTSGKTVTPRRVTPPVELPVSPSLVESASRELEAAGRLDTVLGQQALLLAAQMAAAKGSGSAAAALSRELRAVMDAALAGAPKAADSLDELAKRRERKASGA